MGIFLKSFLASLLALVIFFIVMLFIFAGIVTGLTSPQKVETGSKAVLLLDLGTDFHEQTQNNPLEGLGSDDQYDVPGLYDVASLIRHARTDTAIRGIYISAADNENGFASSEEIRNALLEFKKSGKFIYAFADVISQKAYYVANVADKIYCNPKGGVDWRGFATQIMFLKGALQKLEIEPQIFYAGKFKSATEPLREEKMTDANRIQTTELLNDLYDRLLRQTSQSRGIDTATLRKCVNEHLIRYANDALYYKLVDGLKYDDEVKEEIKSKLGLNKRDKINFIPVSRYAKAVSYKPTGSGQIALIYAEGEVVGGKGDQLQIGGDTYLRLFRRARLDKDIKAVVLRINSGGGSSMVSEDLWRELTITRKEKPVIISFGDVAASGAYYLSCNADSIFAQPNTITGSIGVFSILPNLQKFFKNKLGVTFDGAKTAPDADELSVTQPLTEMQKRFLQNEVDSIYLLFKTRVAAGRNKSVAYIDSIAQGRVWSGEKAIQLGLVDRLGGLPDAIACAARMAKLADYRLKEYPEPKGLLDQILGSYKKSVSVKAMKEELGEDGYKVYQTIRNVRAMQGVTQARMPFDLVFGDR